MIRRLREKGSRILTMVSATVLALLASVLPFASINPSVAASGSDVWQAYMQQAQAALHRNDSSLAVSILKKALAEANQFEPNDIRLARTLDSLGCALEHEHNFKQAEAAFRICLKHREQFCGLDSIPVAVVLQHLADLYLRLEKYGEAKPLFEREIRIIEKTYGQDHRYLALPLYKRATAAIFCNDLNEAEVAASRALKIRESSIGADNPFLYEDLILLGRIESKKEKYAESIAYWERAISIVESGLGPENLALLQPLKYLAEIYILREKRIDKAQLLIERALRISQRTSGAKSKDSLELMFQLWKVCDWQKKFDLADQIYNRFIRDAQGSSAYPISRLQSISLYRGMDLYGAQKFADAERCISYGMPLAIHNSGPDLAVYWGAIAVCQLHQLGKLSQSERSFLEMLKIAERFAGKDRQLVAAALNGLGTVCMNGDRFVEANRYFLRALEIYKATPQTANAKLCRDAYAMLLKRMKEADAATGLKARQTAVK